MQRANGQSAGPRPSDTLPEAAFDLVHARLVLMHLPDREAVLHRLVLRQWKPLLVIIGGEGFHETQNELPIARRRFGYFHVYCCETPLFG